MVVISGATSSLPEAHSSAVHTLSPFAAAVLMCQRPSIAPSLGLDVIFEPEINAAPFRVVFAGTAST
jgi:hypothetical protein